MFPFMFVIRKLPIVNMVNDSIVFGLCSMDGSARRGRSQVNREMSNFEKVFGIIDNKFLAYIILCTKYFIYRCKFQDKKPHINGLKSFIKSQREIEHSIAKRRGKLSLHFKKWSFVL